VLRDPAVPEDRKLAVVDDVAKDPREVATDVLLSAGRSDSVLVAMASIRALRGRPCEHIVAPLASRLGTTTGGSARGPAKVLGENACAAAVPGSPAPARERAGRAACAGSSRRRSARSRPDDGARRPSSIALLIAGCASHRSRRAATRASSSATERRGARGERRARRVALTPRREPTTQQRLECPIDPERSDCRALCAGRAGWEWCR
jgi:hypothetical protein